MAWRNANASVSLVNAVNARWPGRSKASDGTIGDAAHASRSSDHNPWVKVGGVGVVRARDITGAGIDPSWLAEQLRLAGRAGDSRLTGGGYVIYNHRITTPDFSGWKRYTGSNPHTKHVHVSFSQNRAGFDRTDGWAFLGGGGGGAVAPAPAPSKGSVSGSSNVSRATQRAVNFPASQVDGFWGPATEHRVNLVRMAINGKFLTGGVDDAQVVVGTKPDGKWGPKSQNALGQTIRKLQAAWGTGADGIWGPATERAWTNARNANYRP